MDDCDIPLTFLPCPRVPAVPSVGLPLDTPLVRGGPGETAQAMPQPTPCGASPAACVQRPDTDLSSSLCLVAARRQITQTPNTTSQGCYTLTPSSLFLLFLTRGEGVSPDWLPVCQVLTLSCFLLPQPIFLQYQRRGVPYSFLLPQPFFLQYQGRSVPYTFPKASIAMPYCLFPSAKKYSYPRFPSLSHHYGSTKTKIPQIWHPKEVSIL